MHKLVLVDREYYSLQLQVFYLVHSHCSLQVQYYCLIISICSLPSSSVHISLWGPTVHGAHSMELWHIQIWLLWLKHTLCMKGALLSPREYSRNVERMNPSNTGWYQIFFLSHWKGNESSVHRISKTVAHVLIKPPFCGFRRHSMLWCFTSHSTAPCPKPTSQTAAPQKKNQELRIN